MLHHRESRLTRQARVVNALRLEQLRRYSSARVALQRLVWRVAATDAALAPAARMLAKLRLSQQYAHARATRGRLRCLQTGRASGVHGATQLSRLMFRRYLSAG